MRNPDTSAHAPRRFRRRIATAFALVAALSAGVLAIVTFLVAREYRTRTFQQAAIDEANVALALAPTTLTESSFERLRSEYEARSEANMVAVGPAGVFTSSPGLNVDDIPSPLRATSATRPRPDRIHADVDGKSSFVVAAQVPGGTRYYFFFSLEQLEATFREVGLISAAAWALTSIAAGAFGHVTARQTLRPVGAAATAAEAIAAGDLSARLSGRPDDEFGVLAESFNHMADEVQALIIKLEESAARERRFTADVAHELRTPLSAMTATASVLDDQLDQLRPSARHSVSLLIRDIRRLRDLVLELLELSSLDAGIDEVRLEPLRVVDAVGAVVRGIELPSGSKVSLDIEDGAAVLAEPPRLRRVLTNLLSNAAQHGAGTIHVSARRDGSDTVIEVADDGAGIPAADLPHIFDRFYKSDASRAGGGSGLGLAIAREHALAQGGDLSAANGERGGARFLLRLAAPNLTELEK